MIWVVISVRIILDLIDFVAVSARGIRFSIERAWGSMAGLCFIVFVSGGLSYSLSGI